MKNLLEILVNLRGRRDAMRTESECRLAREVQLDLLDRIVRENRDTAFGRDHHFDSIQGMDDYRRRVPVRDFEALRPWVDRVVAGEHTALTADAPFMFNLTSGTTSAPKLIPWNRRADTAGSRLFSQWLYRCNRDHPGMLAGKVLGLVSPAVEHFTPRGVPCGSISGRMYRRLPAAVRGRYALPYAVAGITDYDVRYLTALRLAIEHPVSCVSTPNPATLIQLAETGRRHVGRLIQSVHDGVIGIDIPQADVRSAIARRLKPNPAAARRLERIAAGSRGFLPHAYWPSLRVIACWTGGSVGTRLPELRRLYGEQVPIRDLGYLASEARMSMPIEDDTASGLLAIGNCVFEFLPEDDAVQTDPLLCDELVVGARYRVLLTAHNGLYRYDINDVIEVTGFHGCCPMVRFVRKGRDMTSLTGEKLHVDQCLAAVHAVQERSRVAFTTFRFIADAGAACYRFLVEPAGALNVAAVSRAVDVELGAQNLEYAKKRRAGQLGPLEVVIMRRGWGDAVCRTAFSQGRRDIQYKWRHLVEHPDAEDIRYATTRIDAPAHEALAS